ncbi:MAG: cupin domain-containing protein [Phycisphaerales bacterium]|nr:cupin domain-containing protein [Phycisphaerales bacterium]MCI0629718.1 cupin domain-containing protein [Phycisphaerales bacterium]MCI0674182.1 cupin domain-containing protein [Phycisphaerales bacterium]
MFRRSRSCLVMMATGLLSMAVSGCRDAAVARVHEDTPPENVLSEECFFVDVPAYLKEHEHELYSKVIGKTRVHNIGIFRYHRNDWRDHYHETHDKIIHVLGGEGEFRMEGKLIAMKPGMLISVPKGAVHGFRSVGAEPVEMMWIYIPPMDLENVDQVDLPAANHK